MQSQTITGASPSVLQVWEESKYSYVVALITQTKNDWVFVFILLSGNPQPKFKWYLNNQEVTEGEYIMTIIHDITEREYHGCLQLDNPTHLNNGRYMLEVKNEYGFDRKAVDAHFMRTPWDGEQ